MLNQYAVDYPTFPVNQRCLHLIVIPGRLLSRNNQPPDVWNSQGLSGNIFANPRASLSSRYSGGFNPTSPHVTSESQIPDTVLNPRFQPGLSARNSFDLSEGRFSKNYGADQRRLQISCHKLLLQLRTLKN